MPVPTRKILLSFALTTAITSIAGAQKKECDIDDGKPTQVAKAMLALQIAGDPKAPSASVQRKLAEAVKTLTDAGVSSANPVGRNWVLGKTLVLWSMQDGIGLTAKRGVIGYTSNPEGDVDLPAAIDSAFQIVEQGAPECVEETGKWRQQKAWISLINNSLEELNADHNDSAAVLATRSLQLYRGSPYGHMVLGNVFQKKGDYVKAFSAYKATIAAAGSDTAYREVRQQTLLNLGNVASEISDNAKGAEKESYAKEARNYYEMLVKESPSTRAAEDARSGLVRLSLASGDTSSFKATYAEQIANPGNFTYQALMNSGVAAARANQVGDAAKLFVAAAGKNKSHRDVLLNLAITEAQLNEFEASRMYAQRLVDVDPNNPDAYQVLAVANGNLAKAAKDAYEKGLKSKPVMAKARLDSIAKSQRSYVDEAVKAGETRMKMTSKVEFSDFSSTASTASLAGTISNTASTAKTYAFKVEFLDAAGNVVATDTQSVGPVAPNASGRFAFKVTAPGITAFRYAQLP